MHKKFKDRLINRKMELEIMMSNVKISWNLTKSDVLKEKCEKDYKVMAEESNAIIKLIEQDKRGY